MTNHPNRNKTVTIDTRTVGQYFATQGIVCRNRRVIYSGTNRPYGFTDPAMRDAENWATEHGYRIAKVDEE